ncbi:SDR family NAD(P)-dependent oxidoreductase [Parendozoicomonas haliclonae]|uniref:sulfoacetaldehyde reductase (NADPH) n=1 Tax=Parendozoicomonas haliclonae TaxID=1960125 RepID=A0A1X7AQ58_9GAMM|nr:SDR family NAD(P)-dependent oxidoreductase [Parendozoicomonas haliclonae]SMA50229.1 Sulfoacetaldehyde reductase [Parendozoicomonas haliclonae]
MSKDKCALITGATSGFGLASARKLASEGWDLIITGRREERLQKLAKELEGQVRVFVCVLDVRDNEAVKEMAEKVGSFTRHINLLVNNAGLALGREPAYEAKHEDWQTMIDTNVTGLVNVTHAILPKLMQSAPATIVNLSSVAANWPYPGSHVYGASKAFVSQFSKNLRCDLAGKGVRVTSLEPGMCETEFSLVRFGGDQQAADKVYEGVKAMKAEDIADIIYWIATQPPHININTIEVMAEQQAWSNFQVVRG